MGGYTPWQQKVVQSNYNVRWQCESGFVLGKSQKPQVAYYLYNLYGQLAGNAVQWGNGAPPTPGSFTNFTIPQDNFLPPRKILYHTRKATFMQVFPSLNSTDLMFFLRIPQGNPVGGFINIIGNPDSNFRYPYGYWFKGDDSDIDNPTDAGEFWVPAGLDLEIAVLNTKDFPIIPQSLFVVNQFTIDPYDPKTDLGKKMIMACLKGNVPMTDGTLGGQIRFSIAESSFKEIFGVQPIQWDGQRAVYIQDGKEILIGEV